MLACLIKWDAREMNDHVGRPLRVKSGGRMEALVTPEKDRAANVRGVFASAGNVVAEDGFEPPTRGL